MIKVYPLIKSYIFGSNKFYARWFMTDKTVSI